MVQTIVPPQFDSSSLFADVALLKLSNAVDVFRPNVGTACLPSPGQLFDGQTCWVTGWGKDTLTGQFQNILHKVDVPVVEHFNCQYRLRDTRLGSDFSLSQRDFLCAGGIAGKDACSGDGGSPLVCRGQGGWTVVGLVAWGVGCASPDVPGVYVNVPSFVQWMQPYLRSVARGLTCT